ncbi:hypothetical protein EDC94DRAFT_437573 [Helicostylum pulchrum]|nr:hypothetical protein EDC94DRAFT_437573 [Helicostylum pulchrum]
MKPINDIKLSTDPILVCSSFLKYVLEETRDLICYVVQVHRLIPTLVISLSIILWIVKNTEGPYQLAVMGIQQVVVWYGTWFFLGIASSVAVGAGFHTFVVFLGPYIAQVTLAAYRCGSTDLMIRDPQSFRLVECVVEDNNVNVMLITVWNIFQKVKWESFAWGAGTAFGELPPYFIARALAETEEKIKEFALMSDDDEPTLKTKLLQSVFAMIQRLGFFGILLFASVPNPLFDLAGITCGHFKVPFSRFFGATFIGKACVKATIQTLLVILIFSHDTLYYLLDFIKSNTPASFDQYIERIVRDQTSMFKDSEIKDQNTMSGTIWNYLLSIMVAYYVFCSIEALGIAYIKKNREIKRQ